MPYTPNLPLGFNGDIIQDLVRRVTILEARARQIQNGAVNIVNSAGQTVAIFGQLSDGTYGLEIQDGSGNVLQRINSTGHHIYDGAGHELNRLDTTGLHVYNPSGTEEVRAGALTDGTYGLEVLDPGGSGNLLKLFSPVSATVATSESTTSTSFTDLTTPGPSVSFTVGPSGKAFILASANINPDSNAGGETGYLGLSVDSAAAYGIATASVSVSESFATPAATIQQLSLSPGAHTAKLQYATSSGTTVHFYYRSLLVFTY